MANIAELKAPPGVDRDTLYQEVVKLERKLNKIGEEEQKASSFWLGKMLTGGIGIGTALGGGFLFGKFPQIATIPKTSIQVRSLLAAGALITCMVTEGGISDSFEGAAYGFGLPFLSDWGFKLSQG